MTAGKILSAVEELHVQVLVDDVTDSLSTVPHGVMHEWAHLKANSELVLSGEALCCAAFGLSLVITARVGHANARAAISKASVLAGHYESAIDRESAYEKLKARTEEKQAPQSPPTPPRSATGLPRSLDDLLFGSTGPRGGHREGMLESAATSAARTIGSQVARSILRGALGSMGGRRIR